MVLLGEAHPAGAAGGDLTTDVESGFQSALGLVQLRLSQGASEEKLEITLVLEEEDGTGTS